MKRLVASAAFALGAARAMQLALAAIVLLCFGAVSVAQPQQTESDIIRIIPPGALPLPDFIVPEATPDEPFLAAFFGPLDLANQWILFVEPNGQQSDRLSVRNQFLYFESDPLGPLFPDLPAAPVAVLTEDGTFQRVEHLFDAPPTILLPQILVFSDLGADIPEPASLAIMLVGAIGSTLLVRRRRA